MASQHKEDSTSKERLEGSARKQLKLKGPKIVEMVGPAYKA